jgi:GNAT superfamily N-acetyltransferase
MSHPAVRASTADLDALSHLIAAAFADLAPSKWLITDPAARRQVLPGYFQILVEHALAQGFVHTTGDRAAAALWLPAGPGIPALPADHDAQLAAVTGAWTSRFRAFDTALETRHPAGIPHRHLAILAVRPDRQGQGTGTALLNAGHQICDRDAIPAYLEASDRRTRRLYLRHGYTDHGGPPLQLPDGPQMHPMWRQPRQQAAPRCPS